jgi:hypothetical protein
MQGMSSDDDDDDDDENDDDIERLKYDVSSNVTSGNEWQVRATGNWQVTSGNSIQFNSIQFNSIQFNSIYMLHNAPYNYCFLIRTSAI